MATIYLSSTYGDLIEQRNVVYRALRVMGHDVKAMEDYVATDRRPLDKCLADVAGCELYVGIFAWRYGFVPKESNPEQKSITELEYRKAVEMGKPTLIFLLDPAAQWPMTATDMFTGEGEGGKAIKALREELGLVVTVSFFHSAQELEAKVSQAVSNWEKEHTGGESALVFAGARKKYLDNMCERYGTVKLPVGPPEGFFLNAIFQPLMLRRDPLAAEDLERKKRRQLLGEVASEAAHFEQFDTGVSGKERLEVMGQTPGRTIVENGDQAVEESPQKRVVILGGPGTGKTTTLKYLAAERARKALDDPDAPLPIFLSLPALTRSGKTLQRYLVELVEDMGAESIYAEVLWKEVEAGKAFLCLDSLDEVTPDLRTRVIELIHSWAGKEGNTWIIGSRFTEYKGGEFKQGQFREWELLPMNRALRLELARRLLPELQRLLPSKSERVISAESFVHTLERHAQAAAWGENPLLFSLAAVVFVKSGNLPSSRAMLYREVIEAVLKTSEPDPVRARLLQRMLTELALWLHQSRGRTFSTDDLVTFLLDVQRKSWGESTELIKQVISSRVIEIVARDTYGFRHQTFQEYFAASELARRLTSSEAVERQQAWELAWSKRTFSRWTEILRLMVGVLIQGSITGGRMEAQRWIQALVAQRSSTEGDPGDLGLALGIKSLVEVSESEEWISPQTTEFEQEIICTWFEEFVTAARYQRYSKARKLGALARDIGLLKEQTTVMALQRLVSALDDRSKHVRAEVARALGGLGERMPLKCLFAPLQDRESEVRIMAHEVLDEQGGRLLDDPALMDALNHENADVRSAAVTALGKQGERAPIDVLQHALEDESEWVRSAAVAALGKQGERVGVEVLQHALEDENADVRSAAVAALGEQGERVKVEVLLHALLDDSWFVQKAAMEVLSKQLERIPSSRMFNAISNGNWNVRRAAVEVLGKQGEHAPLEVLQGVLEDKSESVRSAAVVVLGKQGERVAVEVLQGVLEDKSESVRRVAVEALGNQGERVKVEVLLHALEDESAWVRKAAVAALGEQGERVKVEVLQAALEDEDADVRKAAVAALGEQGERVKVEVLLHALQDESEYVRRAAVTALGKEGERVAVEVLLHALQDESADVRRAAVEALGEQGERVPIEVLLHALQDESADVRSAAVTALGKQGERVAVEVLLPSLQDEWSSVREAAVRALGEQGGRVQHEQLLALVGDDDVDVRNAAIEVVNKLAPALLDEVANEAIAILQGNLAGRILGSIAQGFIAEVLGEMGYSTPMVFDKLVPMLDWHYWQVRVKAARALGKIRRNVPDVAIRRLLAMRSERGPLTRTVSEAADDALSEILSLETGIEDE